MEHYNYEVTREDLFENIITDENLILNHVILEPGKRFPRHNTDAIVYMIIISGTITVRVGEMRAFNYTKGDILNLPFDIPSELSNLTDDIVELFVVKIRP